ncbi:MAG: hypothetical protein FWD15_00185 [Alphaproteobacteria bacterium]|nr:hypothetical protein [Alphaproteobacteria bacterium]
MTFKEIIEVIAALLTVVLSIVALSGIFAAHRRGFFQMFHNVVEYLHDITEIKDKPKRKKKR